MNKLEQLAKLMCPDVTLTIQDLEERYPARDLKEGARVPFENLYFALDIPWSV